MFSRFEGGGRSGGRVQRKFFNILNPVKNAAKLTLGPSIQCKTKTLHPVTLKFSEEDSLGKSSVSSNHMMIR